jgi:hypothetical protein
LRRSRAAACRASRSARLVWIGLGVGSWDTMGGSPSSGSPSNGCPESTARQSPAAHVTVALARTDRGTTYAWGRWPPGSGAPRCYDPPSHEPASSPGIGASQPRARPFCPGPLSGPACPGPFMGPPPRRAHPASARRCVGRNGRGMGHRTRDRSSSCLPDGSPGAPHRA